jgi:peptidyl-prolyl cis-trans isomerase D
MVMKALRDGAAGGVGKFILMGFMALAVGGLVVMDIGGFFSNGGVSNSDVARVGKQTIPIAQFDRSARMTLQRIGMTPQEAYKVGYLNQILMGEVRNSLLNQAAAESGVLVDKNLVAKQIHEMIEPLSQDGQNPQQVLDQVLRNQGVSEAQFVHSVGQEMANSLLIRALQAGFAATPTALANDLYLFQNEKRTAEYVVFPDSEITDVPAPTDEQLKSVYEATKENNAQDELRTFKIITVKTDALKSTIDITEEQIRQNYDANIEMYTVAKTWTLDQALLSTEDQAKKVADAAKTGKSIKQAVQDAIGNTTGHLGEKSFEENTLLTELKAPVTAAKQGDVIGPINSPLGWYVISVKKISDTQTRPFAEVKADIKNDLLANQLVDQQYALANTVDDMLAGGATLEDVAKEVDLDIKALTPVTQYGVDKDGKDALQSVEKIRTNILDTGFQLQEGETSPVFENVDGDFVAIQLSAVTPKTYVPFEEAKKHLIEQYMSDNKRLANQDRVRKLLGEMTGGGKSLKDVAEGKSVQTLNSVTRTHEPSGPLNPRSVQVIFEAPLNTPFLLDTEGGMALAVVTESKLPEAPGKDNAALKEMQAAITKNAQGEASLVYLEQKSKEYGTRLNNRLIDKVYGASAQQQSGP